MSRLDDLKSMISIQTDDCILWTYALQGLGYGVIVVNRQRYGTHRLALVLSGQPEPEGRWDAAHSCDVKACVNPRHLSWQSRSQNLLEAYERGLSNAHNKRLTDDDVREIRRLYYFVPGKDGVAQSGNSAELAERFGVSQGTISGIFKRRKRADVEDY